MHISSVIKISFCRISFSGHQNKFCACLDSIYGSRVILVMCKNCSDIRWHRLNSNQSKTNCPKNLNSDGLIVREMGPWPECIFRSLLQFLVYNTIVFLHKYNNTYQWHISKTLFRSNNNRSDNNNRPQVSDPVTAAFHPVACVCALPNDKTRESLCSLHCRINSFYYKFMLLYEIIYAEIIDAEFD